jgi:hypothetical protein
MVRPEVSTAVFLSIQVIWDITLYRKVVASQHFEKNRSVVVFNSKAVPEDLKYVMTAHMAEFQRNRYQGHKIIER